jgi:hypothetical protein
MAGGRRNASRPGKRPGGCGPGVRKVYEQESRHRLANGGESAPAGGEQRILMVSMMQSLLPLNR